MSNFDGVDYQQLRQLRIQQLLQSLQLIPDDDKMELIEALGRAPNLVQLESDPMKFLKREKFDTNAAARRLASYWKYRKQFFGERAFLPMTLFGDGALNSDDVAAYMKGYQIIIPDHPSGNPVLFTDRESHLQLDPVLIRRIAFYNFQVLSEKDSAIFPGFVSLIVTTSFSLIEADMQIGKLLLEGLPVTMQMNQFIHNPDGSPIHNVFSWFASAVTSIFGNTPAARNSKFMLASTLTEKRTVALSLGFRLQDIPESVGGAWNFNSFSSWLQERLIVETERHAGCIYTLASASNVPEDTNSSSNYGSQTRLDNNSFPHQHLSANIQAATLQQQQQQQQLDGLLRLYQLNHIQQLMGIPTSQAPQNLSLNTEMPLISASSAQAPLPNVLPYAQPEVSFDKDASQAVSADVKVPPESSEKKPGPLQSKDLTQPVKSIPVGDPYEKLGISSEKKLVETDEVLDAARSRFNEALRSIPEDEKASYLEALRSAPDLVRRESNPLYFIRAEHYDSWAAARRMINYWNLRKKLFGCRAFLPMIQTGYGALTRDDVVAFSSGAIALLPNDYCGRSVLCSDRSKILNSEDEKTSGALLRALFYLGTILAENETNQREGIIVVLSVISPRVFEFKAQTIIDRSKVLSCTPVWLKAFHLVVCPPKSGKRNLAEQIVNMVTRVAGTYQGKKAILHSGGSIEDIQCKLEEYGLAKENLPSSMGGTWKYEEFTKWQRHRTQEERSTHRASKAQELPPLPPTEASAPLSSEEKKARKRKLNIIHSRQKRERRRAEVEEIKKRCTELEERNDALRKENSRFEIILQDARAKLSLLHGGVAETSTCLQNSSAQPGFCQTAPPANLNNPDFQQMDQIQSAPIPMTGLYPAAPNQFFNDNIAVSALLPVQQQLSQQAGDNNFGNVILPTQQQQMISCTTNQNQIFYGNSTPQNDRFI